MPILVGSALPLCLYYRPAAAFVRHFFLFFRGISTTPPHATTTPHTRPPHAGGRPHHTRPPHAGATRWRAIADRGKIRQSDRMRWLCITGEKKIPKKMRWLCIPHKMRQLHIPHKMRQVKKKGPRAEKPTGLVWWWWTTWEFRAWVQSALSHRRHQTRGMKLGWLGGLGFHYHPCPLASAK